MTDNTSLTLRLADWKEDGDCRSVVSLLSEYALHPMGGGQALDASVTSTLPQAMANMPGAFSVLAASQGEDIGLANCFTGFSTFACRPLINIHDLFVSGSHRGRGAGQALLGFIERTAMQRGCCKVTLEVLSGNKRALASYLRFGFKPYELDNEHGQALFMQKVLSADQ